MFVYPWASAYTSIPWRPKLCDVAARFVPVMTDPVLPDQSHSFLGFRHDTHVPSCVSAFGTIAPSLLTKSPRCYNVKIFHISHLTPEGAG